jgi:4-hydroxybenzoate polyprenyltransferase
MAAPEPSATHPVRRVALLCDSMRLANLPSVISNVWLGVALAAFLVPTRGNPSGGAAGLLALAGAALYVGGNLLNDWHDRHWDARQRPERALPQGAFPPRLYLAGALILLASGPALAAAAAAESGLAGTATVLAILGYTRWHKRHPASVLLMGLCRALLPLLALAPALAGACGQSDWPLLIRCLLPSLALMAYITGLSLFARREAAGTAPSRVSLPTACILLAPVLMAGPAIDASGQLLLGSGLLAFVIWTALALDRSRLSVQRQVAALLAGLPLLDAVLLLPLGFTLLAGSGSQARGILSLALPPAAFLLSLALQRRAAAT